MSAQRLMVVVRSAMLCVVSVGSTGATAVQAVPGDVDVNGDGVADVLVAEPVAPGVNESGDIYLAELQQQAQGLGLTPALVLNRGANAALQDLCAQRGIHVIQVAD